MSREKSPLEKAVVKDLDVWYQALKLGLMHGTFPYSSDLSMMVAHLRKLHPLENIENTNVLCMVMRAYGVLNRPNEVAKCLELAQKRTDDIHPVESAILAYGSCNANEQVDRLLATISTPSESLKKGVVRNYAFSGDVSRTRQHCGSDDTSLFLAYKNAISREYECQIHNALASTSYYTVKFHWYNDLKTLDKAFEKDLKQRFLDKSTGIDISQCNFIMSYLSKAHFIKPTAYPIARIEKFVREEMPARGVKPNGSTYSILLQTYSRSQEFQDTGYTNTRLDKALGLFQEMQQLEGLDFDMRSAFQNLYRACVPHRANYYPFDYFLYASNPRIRRIHLDKRFFDIEKIMLDSRIPYDKQSYMLALTCLAASGQYKAMWTRWRLIKQSGFRRDNSLYRHVFALASMDKEQAQYALSVIKEELVRELPQGKVDWKTYTAMLDCCITAQEPRVAKQIMTAMQESNLTDPESTFYYRPMLRASTMIKGLESEAVKLFEEVKNKDIPYDTTLWKAAMYRAVSEGGDDRGQKIQQLFTKYTMDRFQKLGKIPIPIRERAPVVPFPSGPYSTFDMHMIDLYIASLVDSQDVSLALDVFKTLKEQQPGKLRLSGKTVGGFIQLAKREKSDEDLAWLSN
ncbi:hypothetical protein BJV82DRAFT_576701 [Fennellomyces sp. T-0311]|nr:hypothetical protein BJV82DRAFT_576701 [Fennellomyces sp. T-0311]